MIPANHILDRLALWLKTEVSKSGNKPNFLVRFDAYDDRSHLLIMVACEAAILHTNQGQPSSVVVLVNSKDLEHEFVTFLVDTYADVLLTEVLSTEEGTAEDTLITSYAKYASLILPEHATPNITTFLAVMDEVRAQALEAVQLSPRDRDSAVLREEESTFVFPFAPLEALHVREIASVLAFYGFAYEECYTRFFLTHMPHADFFVDMETVWDFSNLDTSFEEAFKVLQSSARLSFTEDERDILEQYYKYTQTPQKQQGLYTHTPSRTLILKEVLT